MPAVIRKRGSGLGTAAIETTEFHTDGVELFTEAWGHTVHSKAVELSVVAASSMGVFLDDEIAALNKFYNCIVNDSTTVFELIVVSQLRPMNSAILAFSGSGKTTLLHGVIHHIHNTRPGSVVIAGDPNHGTID